MQISSVQRLDEVIHDLRFIQSEMEYNDYYVAKIDDIIQEIGSIIEED